MDNYIVNLIKRMGTPDAVKQGKPFSSGGSVSFNAHREAEALTDKSYIKQLTEYIPAEKNKTARDGAYFILGKLLSKTPAPKALQFFINRLNEEKDKYVLANILDRLADIKKETTIDIAPIIKCAADEKWQVRHAAIKALAHAKHQCALERLSEIIRNSDHKKNKHDIIYAIAALGKTAEAKYIEELIPLTNSRVRDIKESAAFAIKTLQECTA